MECGAYYWIFRLICRNAVLYVVLGSRKIVPKNLPPLELWQPTPVLLPEESHGQDSPWVPRVGQDLMTKPWSCTQTVTLSANKISFISFVLSYLIKKNWGVGAVLDLHCCTQAFSSCAEWASQFDHFCCCRAGLQ